MRREPVEKERPSRANNPLQGEEKISSWAKLPTITHASRKRMWFWTDLSNLVLQARRANGKDFR
jgi:hypothetical protein